ncbi:penicillin acylase family protein [Algiphilus sp.]|uniref:penicillin acylase family protein n=1 Tax=Algiphilus sp. TaxID=1872431 RepID=UPI003BABE646
MARWLLRGLVVAMGLAVALCAAAAIVLWASRPLQEGTLPLRGLRAAVTIERDAQGVPTVYARSRVDLARATGFLHAQERFFQMDLARRGGAGELAALVGAEALPFDRARRVFLLRERAREWTRRLPPEQQALLFAYRDGVNAGLEQLSADPLEYLLLRQSPQPWAVEDTFLVAAAMFFLLTDEHAERALKLARMETALPLALVDFLVPTRTPWDAPLQGEGAPMPALPGPDALDLRSLPSTLFLGEPASTRRLSGLGSNSFAVAAAHTGGGSALLAGDMHLGLDLPNTWYRMRFRVDAQDHADADRDGHVLDLVGVTLPGLPVMVAGSNGHVAWAFTNSYGAWSERVVLALAEGGYRTPEGVEAFGRHDQRLEVAGGEAVEITVETTRWGPVVEGTTADERHAVRWLAALEGAVNLEVIGMESARTLEEAVAVLNGAGLPPQSAVVATRTGRIGWTIAGRIPDRAGPAAMRPVSWQQAGAWRGWLDESDYPRLLDPPSGRLATANARLLDGADLALLGDGGYAFAARQQRLAERLQAEPGPVDVTAALAIQTDVENHYLAHWQRYLRTLLESPEAAEYPWRDAVNALLSEAVPTATVDSARYALLRRWNQRVSDQVLHAVVAPVRARFPDFAADFPASQAAVWAMIEAQPAHLLDPRYASWPALLLDALDVVIRRAPTPVAQFRWGRNNQLDMRHPLSRALPALSPLLDMPAVGLPGDRDVVRVQGPRFGASQRLIVRPGGESEGVFHMPGGQSGHPLSPHYRAGHDDWVEAQASPLLPGPTVSSLRLQPPS